MTLDWEGLLSNPNAVAVLGKLFESNLESITPTVDKEGRITYGDISEALGDGGTAILETLATAGVFDKSSEARLMACPTHPDSMDLVPRLRCPACNSMLIKKGTLYQHICGHIAPIESYKTNCPQCGKPAPEQTMKLVGSWYECEQCKTRSANPNVYVYCRKFNHDFPISQAILIDRASYKLTAEASLELRQRFGPIMGIAHALLERKIQVKLSGRVRGASGVEHAFDLVVGEGEGLVPIDVKVSPGGEVPVVAVLGTYAKVLDIKARASVLVAIPAASADAKKSAVGYGMILIEGKTPEEVVGKLVSGALPNGILAN